MSQTGRLRELRGVLTLLLAAGCGGAPFAPGAPSLVDGAETARSGPGYVKTPGGTLHSSCLHPLGAGDRLEQDGIIRRASGVLEAVRPCTYPGYLRTHRLATENEALPSHPAPGAPGPAGPTAEGGWVETAFWYPPESVGAFSVRFRVPDPPEVYEGQLIYLFPALEGDDAGGFNILQPVLQYGRSPAGGGAYWAIASWMGGGSWEGNLYSSPLIRVNVGDELSGTMRGDPGDCTSAGCTWTVSTTQLSSGATTTLSLRTHTTWSQVYGGTLEAAAVKDCQDYPGPARFWDFQVSTWQTGQALLPSFAARTWYATCGERIQNNGESIMLVP